MSLPAEALAALDSFQGAPGWEQRARLLMQWGERLAPLSDADKVEANRVHGCESQVWLVGTLQDGHWQFAASSDARQRSEERRVGKECRSRWSPYH